MIRFPVYKSMRIALNLLFFAFFVITTFENNKSKVAYATLFFFQVLIFTPGWMHVFVLLPKLRKNKRFSSYIISTLAIGLVGIWILGSYFKWLQGLYHTNDIYWFTSLAITASAPNSLAAYQFFFDVLPDIVIIAAALTFGYVLQTYFLDIRKEQQIRLQQNKAELMLLKSQVSPHFLFNVLNSIYSLSLSKSDKISDVVLQLSDILRYMLYQTQDKEIALQQEIEIIEAYIGIEQMRIPSTAAVAFEYDAIDASIRIAPLLMLPLIENAFKHGIDSTIDRSYIDATLKIVDNRLIFNCRNNFKAPKKEAVAGGIGLQNIQRRLQLLYPNRHLFRYQKNDAIFEVQLEITLSNKSINKA